MPQFASRIDLSVLRIGCMATVLLFHICLSSSVGVSQNPETQGVSEFAGRYTDGADYAVYFEPTKFGLTIRPVLWTSTQVLTKTGEDKFVVADRPSRTADFTRDGQGRIAGVTIRGMDGEGLQLTKAVQPLLPIELFLSGRTHEAANGYKARGPAGTAKALETAEQVLRRQPSKIAFVVDLLNEFAAEHLSDAKFHALLGYAYVQAGKRTLALTSLQAAYRLDPTNERAVSGLARLNSLPASTVKSTDGWTLPFPLTDVFARPTAAEIKAVEADWASRDLSPQGIREEMTGSIRFEKWTGNVRIVSHLVHGSRHYGAIITPENARPGCCPVIIDAKGVSATYFPLDLDGVRSPRMMGESGGRFVYVVPSFRGEVLNFDGRSFTSEGDRTDALDGATDDAIALLNAALQTTPQADEKRICAFGHSRGGNVALLAGIRDRRIGCVVDWAGPTDWFYLMGTSGWTEQELWAEGLRTRANTLQTGGQNIERFLLKAIKGEEGLQAVRHRMIASSPLYFAKRLPRSQFHYGLEDPSVPSRNGYEIVEGLRRNGVSQERYQAFFYPGQGHDTDRLAAPAATADFIRKVLLIGK